MVLIFLSDNEYNIILVRDNTVSVVVVNVFMCHGYFNGKLIDCLHFL